MHCLTYTTILFVFYSPIELFFSSAKKLLMCEKIKEILQSSKIFQQNSSLRFFIVNVLFFCFISRKNAPSGKFEILTAICILIENETENEISRAFVLLEMLRRFQSCFDLLSLAWTVFIFYPVEA